MNKISSKKLFVIIISIILLGILFSLVLYKISYKPSVSLNYNEQKEENQPSNIEKSNSSSESSNTVVPVKLAYGEAVNIYAGKRIQFDPSCVASPTSQVFKKGVVIMLDNRSDKTRKISLDGKSYTIPAYDYSLATVTTTASLPHTILIDCDTRQNVASITIQK